MCSILLSEKKVTSQYWENQGSFVLDLFLAKCSALNHSAIAPPNPRVLFGLKKRLLRILLTTFYNLATSDPALESGINKEVSRHPSFFNPQLF